MADNTPAPGGAVPPKPSEASKVQPKKETVRINLPPKPTAAPTIKLPTLSAGAPPPTAGTTGAAAPAAIGAPRPSSAAPPPPQPPSSAAPSSRMAVPASPASAAPKPAPVPAPRPMPSAVGGGQLTGLDKGLAIAAAVASLAALAAFVYLKFFMPDSGS